MEPMTFLVTRTSQYGSDEPPCPEAYRGRRTFDKPAFRQGERDVWLIDIPDIETLLAFIDRHDRAIITRSVGNDMWSIEIYDDYRE